MYTSSQTDSNKRASLLAQSRVRESEHMWVIAERVRVYALCHKVSACLVVQFETDFTRSRTACHAALILVYFGIVGSIQQISLHVVCTKPNVRTRMARWLCVFHSMLRDNVLRDCREGMLRTQTAAVSDALCILCSAIFYAYATRMDEHSTVGASGELTLSVGLAVKHMVA